MFEKMFTRCNPLLNEWHQRSSVTARYFEDERVIRGRVDATIHPSLRHRTSMAVGSALSGRNETLINLHNVPRTTNLVRIGEAPIDTQVPVHVEPVR